MPVTQGVGSSNTRGTGGTGGGNGSNPQDYSIGINEQLALAVIRLQQSMDQVVNRLDTLESMLTRDSRVINLNNSSFLIEIIGFNVLLSLIVEIPFS